MMEAAKIYQVAMDMAAEAKGVLSINEVLKLGRRVPEHLRDLVHIRGLVGLPSPRTAKQFSTSSPLEPRPAPNKKISPAHKNLSQRARILMALRRSEKKLTSQDIGRLSGLTTKQVANAIRALLLDGSVKKTKIKKPEAKGPRYLYRAA